MSDPYEIAVAVGGLGDRMGYVLYVQRGERRKVIGPRFVDPPTSHALDTWTATYDGITHACRLKIEEGATREVLVVLQGAVQVLHRRDADRDDRAPIATAAKAVRESRAFLRWVHRDDGHPVMTTAHQALARVAERVLHEEMST